MTEKQMESRATVMRDDPVTATMPLGWKLAMFVAGALGLAAVVAACWFGFALLAIRLGLPGE